MATIDHHAPPRPLDTAAMNNALIYALIKTYRNGSECAAALGMTRQAFNAALTRQHLSESKAMLAAILLNIDPGRALLDNSRAAQNPPAPVRDARPTLPDKPTPPALYYVKYRLSAKAPSDTEPRRPKRQISREYCADCSNIDIRARLLFYRRLLKKGVFFRLQYSDSSDAEQLGFFPGNSEASSNGLQESRNRQGVGAYRHSSESLTGRAFPA